MIKNRESAFISRKKKKDYLTYLEEQMLVLSSENMSVRSENENLKENIQTLQLENKNINL